MKNNKQNKVKVREDITFNYFEHYPTLYDANLWYIKDKEQIVKTTEGWYRLIYRDTADNTRYCGGCYVSLDTLIKKERINMNKCVCLN